MSDKNNLLDLKEIAERIEKLNKKLKEQEKTPHTKEIDSDEIRELNIEILNEIWTIPLHCERNLVIENYSSMITFKNNPYERNYAISQVVLNLDSLTKSQLKNFTQGEKYFLKILRMWRDFLDSQKKFFEYDVEGRVIGKSELKKWKIRLYNVVGISRKESLETLIKIIRNEYERMKLFFKKEPMLTINHWDFGDIFIDIKKDINHELIFVDYEMFPGEFRIQTKPLLEELIYEFNKNKFILNLRKVLNSAKNSENYNETLLVFRPTKFCAPDAFNKKYRNLKNNTYFYFWHGIKKWIYLFWKKLREWSSPLALIVAICALVVKKTN